MRRHPSEQTLTLFAAGDLPGDEAREVTDHVVACDACAAVVSQASQVLAELTVGTSADPGAAFFDSLSADIVAEAAAAPMPRAQQANAQRAALPQRPPQRPWEGKAHPPPQRRSALYGGLSLAALTLAVLIFLPRPSAPPEGEPTAALQAAQRGGTGEGLAYDDLVSLASLPDSSGEAGASSGGTSVDDASEASLDSLSQLLSIDTSSISTDAVETDGALDGLSGTQLEQLDAILSKALTGKRGEGI